MLQVVIEIMIPVTYWIGSSQERVKSYAWSLDYLTKWFLFWGGKWS